MPKQTEKLLITRGDDMGSFPEANRAIIDAHRAGTLRCAGVMAPAPAFAEAAELARAQPGLCVGLHLTLTSEWDQVRWRPLCDPSEVPSLVGEDGAFLASPMDHHQRPGGVVIAEMMRELRAQLAHARRHGLDIRYIDEHMGIAWVHPLPHGRRLVEYIRDWAREEGILWHTDIQPMNSGMPAAIQARCGAVPTVAAAMEAVAQLGPGLALYITHPACRGGGLDTIRARGPGGPSEGNFVAVRAAEAAIFLDPAFRRACEEHGVRLVSYPEAAEALGLDARTGAMR